MLRPDAPEQRLRPGGATPRRSVRVDLRRLRRRRLAVVVLRRHRARDDSGMDNVFELSELLVQRLGVDDVGASFAGRVTYHSTCHSLRDHARRRRAAAAPAERPRARARRAAARRRVLRVRRDVRDQERRHVERDARRQVRRDRVDRRAGTAPRSTAPACCRSAAASRAAGQPSAPIHLAEILAATMTSFPEAARVELANPQLRPNLRNATDTIRSKRASVVAELPDWEELRDAGSAIKADVLAQPRPLPARSSRAPCVARRRARPLGPRRGRGERGRRRDRPLARVDEVVKVKSLTTDEIELNRRWPAVGVHALETDFAELILQLDGDWSSHILVPAIHRNRTEIRDLFARTIAPGITSDDPRDLAEAARLYLRERFLRARVGVSGANFGIAETGTVCVVESEGNGRMCTTLPPVLVTVLGIEKLLPTLLRPRGLPAAAAALVDGRADEPLHVALDRRHRRRRAAGVPRRAARQRPHAGPRPTRSAARRSTASAAARA